MQKDNKSLEEPVTEQEMVNTPAFKSNERDS